MECSSFGIWLVIFFCHIARRYAVTCADVYDWLRWPLSGFLTSLLYMVPVVKPRVWHLLFQYSTAGPLSFPLSSEITKMIQGCLLTLNASFFELRNAL